MQFLTRRRSAVAASLLVLALTAVGCGSKDDSSSAASSGDTSVGGKVALLLPESKTTRYEQKDRPLFTAKLKQLCPNCELIYNNADQDANKQLSQAESALTNGAKVLVLDPVDATSAAAIVTKAKQQNVKVVSYDRLVKSADIDYYISFDNEQVGRLQGQALLDKLTADGKASATNQIVMINGSPTDNNATLFKKGAHSVLDGKIKIGKEYDTPDWSNDKAQDEMQQAITALGKDNFVGVYAANDGTAGGAIAAMKAAGLTTIPPTTGQDAELAAVQRIIAGEQYMTVYKSVKAEAELAATLAADIVQGKTTPTPTGNTDTGAGKSVPSFILTPVAVTKDKIKDTIVADEFYTVAQICTTTYVTQCKTVGLSA